jgi:hypothetical protein
MRLIFQRIGERRYAIRVQRPDLPDYLMWPAPGYDSLVPHDLLHLVVEAQLRITDGIFGQLAAGGDARTFQRVSDSTISLRANARARRRSIKRGKKLRRKGREDSLQSERATYICWYEWLSRSAVPERRKQALAMRDTASHIRSIAPREEMYCLDDALTRVCHHLDELTSHWSRLRVGESITIRWPDLAVLPPDCSLQDSDLSTAKLAVATNS